MHFPPPNICAFQLPSYIVEREWGDHRAWCLSPKNQQPFPIKILFILSLRTLTIQRKHDFIMSGLYYIRCKSKQRYLYCSNDIKTSTDKMPSAGLFKVLRNAVFFWEYLLNIGGGGGVTRRQYQCSNQKKW